VDESISVPSTSLFFGGGRLPLLPNSPPPGDSFASEREKTNEVRDDELMTSPGCWGEDGSGRATRAGISHQ